jgi:hypothetical protein
MRVENMHSRNGNPVPNQFILSEEGRGANGNFLKKEVFQSYDSIIVERITWRDRVDITLDASFWNFSVTTSKYRSLFLGESTRETEAKIKSGAYKLACLNGGKA